MEDFNIVDFYSAFTWPGWDILKLFIEQTNFNISQLLYNLIKQSLNIIQNYDVLVSV